MRVKTYTVGTKLFCDFAFGGKPSAICIAVLTPGTGKDLNGKIRVRLTETVGAYRKGEELTVDSCYAVPKAQELKLKKGQFFRRVSTCFAWI